MSINILNIASNLKKFICFFLKKKALFISKLAKHGICNVYTLLLHLLVFFFKIMKILGKMCMEEFSSNNLKQA